MKRLLIAAALMLLPVAALADTCTSNCSPNTVCNFSAAGSWTGCAAAPPNTAAEDFVIAADQWVSVDTDGVTVGTGSIVAGGVLFWAEDMTTGVDGDGFRTLTITTTGAGTGIVVDGTLRLRRGARLAFDTTAGRGLINVDNAGTFDAQGSVHSTTVAAITSAADNAVCNNGGTALGMKWTITVSDGAEWARAKRRVRFSSGTARNRQFEIVSVSGSDVVVCTNYDEASSAGQNLTPHETVGVFPTLRHNVPDYDPNDTCSAADTPFGCCTGVDAGTCDTATIVPVVGDGIDIIDDVWFYQSAGTAGFAINQDSRVTGIAAMPTMYAINFKGMGASGQDSIDWTADDASTNGADFAYNNFHDYNGSGATFRGFKNFEIYANACHDADTNADDSGGCIQVIPTTTVAGANPAISAVDGVTIRDNDFYRTRGNAIQFNSSSETIYASDALVKHNLVREGCTTATAECNGIEVNACRDCGIVGNVIHDIVRTAVTAGNCVNLQSNAATTVPDDISGADNIMAGSYVQFNWMVNCGGSGISTHAGGVNNESHQQVAMVSNYVGNSRDHGIEGGNVFGNVITNVGMAATGVGLGLQNPLIAAGNVIIATDEELHTIGCDCVDSCIQFDLANGNRNATDASATDNLCIGTSEDGGFQSLDVDGGTDFGVTVAHYTYDGLGRAANGGVRNDASSAKTFTFRDIVATHLNNGIPIRGSSNATPVDACGPLYANRSATTAETTNDSSTFHCATDGDDSITSADQVPGIGYIDRVNRDYNFAAGHPGLTAGTSSAPIGIRAFRFDRDRVDDIWGSVLPFTAPFPVNISNVSNADTDGDGVMDLHDNCDVTVNPAQTDGDDDGKGCACDVGDDCP